MNGNIGISLFSFFFYPLHISILSLTHSNNTGCLAAHMIIMGIWGDVRWPTFHSAHVQNVSNKHLFHSSVRVRHAWKESMPKIIKTKAYFSIK